MELNGKIISFLGDSITEGAGALDWNNCYVERIRKQDLFDQVANHGISGTRIARQRKPSEWPAFDRHFLTRVPEINSASDLVVVFGGTNDFGHGDAPIGKPEDRTEWTFYGALECLCEALIRQCPKARILLLTPLHRLGETSPLGDGFKTVPGAILADYAQAIRIVAERHRLPVLDLFAEGILNPNDAYVRQNLMPDGLHPNDAGHAILAERILTFLRQL